MSAILKGFDRYSSGYATNNRGSYSHSTACGGVVTLLVLAVNLAFVYFRFTEFLDMENPAIY